MEPDFVPIYKEDFDTAKKLHDEQKEKFVEHFKSLGGEWDTWNNRNDQFENIKDESRAIIRWLFNLPDGTPNMQDPVMINNSRYKGVRSRLIQRVIETKYGKITLIQESVCRTPVSNNTWQDDYYAVFGDPHEEYPPWVVMPEDSDLVEYIDASYLLDHRDRITDTQEDFVRLSDGLDTLQHIQKEFQATTKPPVLRAV